MSYHDGFDDYPEPPRAENIALTPENEELRLSILNGLEAAINSDFAHTFEVTDTSDRSKFRLPHPKFLARAVVMRLNGFDDLLEEGVTDTETAPLFSLAVEAKAHQIDIEKATDMSPEEVEALDFVWPDSLQVTLLDHTYSNASTWSYCWQPNARPVGFSFTGHKGGFTKTEDEPSEDVVQAALRIQRGGEGVYITDDGLGRVAEFRAINEMLHNGTADIEATKKLVDAIMINPGTELITVNPIAIRNSLPYFRKLIDTALASPKFRDMLAWQQYWDERTDQR